MIRSQFESEWGHKQKNIMKPKLIFTERALPLILKALKITFNDGFAIAPNGEKIDMKKIIGFKKVLE